MEKVNQSTFKSVQFIGMNISTVPCAADAIMDISVRGDYRGYSDIQYDINQRLDSVKGFVESTVRSEKINKNKDVLKILVIPEFYFRGMLGAYQRERNTQFGNVDSSYHFFQTYFGELKDYLFKTMNEKEYGSALLVLGTLLTSTMAIDITKSPTKELSYIGDKLLKIYDELPPRNEDKKSLLSKMLRDIDQHEKQPLDPSFSFDDACADFSNKVMSNSLNDPYKDFEKLLMDTLNECDSRAEIVVCNDCYIVDNHLMKQDSTIFNNVFRIPKQFKSKEDFILNYMKNKYIQTITKYNKLALPHNTEQKHFTHDNGCIFEYAGLRIGIDICLDHSRKRLLNSLRDNKEAYVDIQIISSCGMSIRDNAVAARKNGYVFICDGEYAPDGSQYAKDKKSHTGLKKVNEANSLTNYESAAILSDYTVLPESDRIKRQVVNRQIHPFPTYEVHIYKPVDLNF